jgi:hypothetical protein
MGAWGALVFADDLGADVRAEWRDAILGGAKPEDATTQLEAIFAEAIADSDDSTVFWLALAAAQAETGRLLPTVRDRAVAIIDAGADLARWEEETGSSRARAQVLERLRARLVGPQPAPKQLRRRRSYIVEFDPGDVVLLRDETRQPVGLVYVVDRYDERGPHPVAELLTWSGGDLPSRDELARLPARRLHPDAGLGLDGKPKPRYFVLSTDRREEAFGPHLGEVIAKAVERPRLADWRKGAANASAPCYTDFNHSWPRLAAALARSTRT